MTERYDLAATRDILRDLVARHPDATNQRATGRYTRVLDGETTHCVVGQLLADNSLPVPDGAYSQTRFRGLPPRFHEAFTAPAIFLLDRLQRVADASPGRPWHEDLRIVLGDPPPPNTATSAREDL